MRSLLDLSSSFVRVCQLPGFIRDGRVPTLRFPWLNDAIALMSMDEGEPQDVYGS
jgi:hypothetical protein